LAWRVFCRLEPGALLGVFLYLFLVDGRARMNCPG
jgi:hypothetical protein